MNKERANARWIARGIQLRIVTVRSMVAAEECLALTPAAATDDVVLMFDDEISSVADQLSIYAEDRAEGALYLRGRIEICPKTAGRKCDQFFEGRDIRLTRETQRPRKSFAHAVDRAGHVLR